MPERSIYINLPVSDLGKSRKFFSKLGFTFDRRFQDETAICMVIADRIYAMLLLPSKFKEFSCTEICDTSKSTEVLTCLSCESEAEAKELVSKAVAAGGKTFKDPHVMDFMYNHAFKDLDGHIWEVVYMDMAAAEKAFGCNETEECK